MGGLLTHAALGTATLTIAVVPWFLGGAIPHSDMVLQLGSIGAACFALAGITIGRRSAGGFAWSCLPLLGLTLVGVLQSLPIYSHPALDMQHSVQFELAEQLPGIGEVTSGSGVFARSVDPAATRAWICRSISLVLIGCVVFETAGSRGSVLFVSSGLVMSGCLMSALALSQRFGASQVLVGDHWKISPTTPFGCFVNPNNAAGWLIVCLASALFLAGALFRAPSVTLSRSIGGRVSFIDLVWHSWQSLVGRVADLTIWQILVACSVTMLLAGLAATLSRAGIIAGGLGLLALLVSRLLAGRWMAAACCGMMLLLLCCAFLSLLELDTTVLSELQTLKDPVSESTGRLLHWSDSLTSFLDFPVLGSGLGAYRFASLPYQRHYTGKWFQRADNQYVELLVESGLAGGVCLLAYFLLAALFVRRVTSHVATRVQYDAESPRWLASSVVFMGAALAGAAFFDYGVSLPSVAVAVVSLVALLERQSVELKSEKQALEKRVVDRSASWVFVPATWAMLLIPSVAMLPDTFASVCVYNAVAPIERLVNKPDYQTLLDSGDSRLDSLKTALKGRPDDLQGQRLRVLFLEMMARRTLLQKLVAIQHRKPNEIQGLYANLNPVTLASLMLDERVSDSVRMQSRREIADSQIQYSWCEESRTLLKNSPFVLTVAISLAANDMLMGRLEDSQLAILQTRFAEPHAASALFQLGNLLFLADRVAECRQCWAQSIAASESFRPQILLRVSDKLGPETALRWFSPESYETSVRTALGVQRSSGLQVLLFKYASELWKTRQPRITEEIVLVRSLHLQATGAAEEALQCLAGYLAEYPSSVVVRKGRARMLEKAGLNGEAYDEWLRVKSFSPADTESDESLERLIQLPPTTHFSPDGQRRSSSRNAVCVCMFIISLNLSAGVECLLASSVVNFLRQNSPNPPGFSGDRGCSESS